MQFIIDFLPLLIALAAYKTAGIYAATIALMILLPMIPIGQKLMGKPVSRIHAWSAVAILVFGTMTLLLRDPRFVMAKPSIVYGVFAIAFLITQLAAGKTLVERMLGEAITLQDSQWRRLNLAWIVFFLIQALLNVFVATRFSEDTWFSFKVFGATGLTLVFIVMQAVYIAMISEDNNQSGQE